MVVEKKVIKIKKNNKKAFLGTLIASIIALISEFLPFYSVVDMENLDAITWLPVPIAEMVIPAVSAAFTVLFAIFSINIGMLIMANLTVFMGIANIMYYKMIEYAANEQGYTALVGKYIRLEYGCFIFFIAVLTNIGFAIYGAITKRMKK